MPQNKATKIKERKVSIGQRQIITRGLAHNIWTDVYHGSLTVTWPRFIALAAVAYILINAVFALLFAAMPNCISHVTEHGTWAPFFFSIETTAGVGYGDMHPQTLYGHVIASIEIFVGLFSIALLTGLIFARFSQPRARLLFAQRPVISLHEGKNTLMFRVANERVNLIGDASAKLWFLQDVITEEGVRFRRFYELPLERSENPTFILSWSIYHVIDETSALFGMTADDLSSVDSAFILSLSGNDETSSQVIRARHIYSHEDIAWGHQYHDILESENDGTPILNYAYFHKVIPFSKAN